LAFPRRRGVACDHGRQWLTFTAASLSRSKTHRLSANFDLPIRFPHTLPARACEVPTQGAEKAGVRNG
jgi:hypothetical protein